MFWILEEKAKFIEYLLKKGIPESNAHYFSFWVELYFEKMVPSKVFFDKKRLEQFSNILIELNYKSWQLKQAGKALNIYFNNFIKGQKTGDYRLECSEKERKEVWKTKAAALFTKIRVKNYSKRTEEIYLNWLKKFAKFCKFKHPELLKPSHIERFLENLAEFKKVSATTQHQALCALVFFYKRVLGQELDGKLSFSKAKKPKRLPIVLSRNEVNRLLEAFSEKYLLIAQLLYGCGLRLFECLGLRIQDIKFDLKHIIVRSGKGNKDRVVPLPEKLTEKLKDQIQKVKKFHKEELQKGYGRVTVPKGISNKFPNAGKEVAWQYLFPSSKLIKDSVTGQMHAIICMRQPFKECLKKLLKRLN